MDSSVQTPRSDSCLDPRTHAFQCFCKDAGLVIQWANTDSLSGSRFRNSGGQQPSRASSLPLKQAICIEMPTFENKDFAYLGFYKSGPYTPGLFPLFPSVK